MGVRASSGSGAGLRASQRLANAGGGIMQSSGALPGARNTSYNGRMGGAQMGSARGAATASGGLNSAMLASLNKEANRATRKSGLPLPGRVKKDRKADEANDNIESALDLRASRGELPKKVNFE